ncbi:hypothetical protein HBI09_140340 [Parastagonospora nodorum]|nr:hypothetical protein HBI09_140340 [Parastagonospora nodorum]
MLAKSSSVISNRSIALITNKFSVALLTKLAILNNANIALVDAVHYSIIKQFSIFRLITKEIIDALTITLIKDNDDLLGTVNSYIKPPLKRCKTKAADSRYIKLGKKAQLKKTRNEEKLAKTKKEKEEKELIDAYILYFKELLSNNSRIFANAIGIGKTRAIVLAVLIEYFYFFSNSPLENIGRLIKEEAIEMQINTTNAIFKALTATNKLIILEANTPAVHSKATKHYLALFRKVDKHIFRAYNTISIIAQRTIIRKGSSYIEKRGQTIFNKFYNCKLESIIIAKDSVTSDRIYKIEDAHNIITNIKHDASKHKLSYKDILEKEGLNKLEASRRVAQFKTYSSCKVKRFTLNSIKNLFTNLSKDYFLVQEARAITKSSLNIIAEDAAKAANILLLPKEVCAKILIKSYKLIVQAIIVALIAFAEIIILIEATHVVIIELQDNIVYFNLDSKLELKVLSKQDVKTTS